MSFCSNVTVGNQNLANATGFFSKLVLSYAIAETAPRSPSSRALEINSANDCDKEISVRGTNTNAFKGAELSFAPMSDVSETESDPEIELGTEQKPDPDPELETVPETVPVLELELELETVPESDPEVELGTEPEPDLEVVLPKLIPRLEFCFDSVFVRSDGALKTTCWTPLSTKVATSSLSSTPHSSTGVGFKTLKRCSSVLHFLASSSLLMSFCSCFLSSKNSCWLFLDVSSRFRTPPVPSSVFRLVGLDMSWFNTAMNNKAGMLVLYDGMCCVCVDKVVYYSIKIKNNKRFSRYNATEQDLNYYFLPSLIHSPEQVNSFSFSFLFLFCFLYWFVFLFVYARSLAP